MTKSLDVQKHLPECIHPQRDYPCAWCQEIDCECPCICDRLRACEQRAEAGAYNAGYVDGSKDAREGAFYEARERIMRLPYEIDEEILVDRDEVIGWIDALREECK